MRFSGNGAFLNGILEGLQPHGEREQTARSLLQQRCALNLSPGTILQGTSTYLTGLSLGLGLFAHFNTGSSALVHLLYFLHYKLLSNKMAGMRVD
jgi:hypothetical protein